MQALTKQTTAIFDYLRDGSKFEKQRVPDIPAPTPKVAEGPQTNPKSQMAKPEAIQTWIQPSINKAQAPVVDHKKHHNLVAKLHDFSIKR